MKRCFTLFIVLSPIISIYASPIPGVDLSVFIGCLMGALLLGFTWKHDKKIHIIPALAFFMVYIILGIGFSYFLLDEMQLSNIVLRVGRFVLYICFLLFVGYDEYFDFNLAIKYLKMVTLIAVTYIILQTIFYYGLHLVIPNVAVRFIKETGYVSRFTDRDFLSIQSNMFRPESIFLEPSHFSQYVLLYLSYCLFGYRGIGNNIKQALFISIGIVLSTSGSGLLLMGLLWLVWYITNFSIYKITPKKILNSTIIITLCIIVLPVILKTKLVQLSIERLFSNNVAGGSAFEGRAIAYKYFFELPIVNQLMGMGYGNVPDGVYFNSVAYILYGCGIIGMLLVTHIFIRAFVVGKEFQKVFSFIWFIMIFGSFSFDATSICFYYSYIYFKDSIVEKNVKGVQRKNEYSSTNGFFLS